MLREASGRRAPLEPHSITRLWSAPVSSSVASVCEAIAIAVKVGIVPRSPLGRRDELAEPEGLFAWPFDKRWALKT